MSSEGYDPFELADRMRKVVVDGTRRKYYRLGRMGRWYGGIASSDCLGCSLKCVFCWSDKPRDHPDSMGEFCEPEAVYRRLVSCAQRGGYSQMRISGNEPTLAPDHLLELLGLVDGKKYRFILETNGIHIDEDSADNLSRFDFVHVRVSLKGANEDEFARLTGAKGEFFQYQLNALEHLVSSGVSCHAAVMSSFSTEENLRALKERLRKIHRDLPGTLEEEEVILYPHVIRRLEKAGIEATLGERRNR